MLLCIYIVTIRYLRLLARYLHLCFRTTDFSIFGYGENKYTGSLISRLENQSVLQLEYIWNIYSVEIDDKLTTSGDRNGATFHPLDRPLSSTAPYSAG
jgi:hypothetical protein